jgi:hypothetical protein
MGLSEAHSAESFENHPATTTLEHFHRQPTSSNLVSLPNRSHNTLSDSFSRSGEHDISRSSSKEQQLTWFATQIGKPSNYNR